jgi:tetratricopeptide (TPR) repeat protein
MYEGPARPKNEVAIVADAAGSDGRVTAVDGKKRSAWVKRFEVLPGPHGAAVSFRKSIVHDYGTYWTTRTWYSEKDASINFQAAAGHRYAVHAEVYNKNQNVWIDSNRLPKSWYELLPEGKGVASWRGGIDDLDAGKVAADTKPVDVTAVPQASVKTQERDAETLSGSSMLRLGRNEEALKAFTRATELDPKSIDAWYGKGLALRALGRYAEAVQAYDAALMLKPGKELREKVLYEKGLALQWATRYEEAEACYDQVLASNPNLPDAWWGKGAVLGNLKRHDEALKCFDKALKLNQYHQNALWGKALALSKLGQDAEALKYCDRALDLNANNQKAWVVKGDILRKLGREEDAKKAYERAAELKPGA